MVNVIEITGKNFLGMKNSLETELHGQWDTIKEERQSEPELEALPLIGPSGKSWLYRHDDTALKEGMGRILNDYNRLAKAYEAIPDGRLYEISVKPSDAFAFAPRRIFSRKVAGDVRVRGDLDSQGIESEHPNSLIMSTSSGSVEVHNPLKADCSIHADYNLTRIYFGSQLKFISPREIAYTGGFDYTAEDYVIDSIEEVLNNTGRPTTAGGKLTHAHTLVRVGEALKISVNPEKL
jgi:hypothetical protein